MSDFGIFWAVYPKRVAKKDAERAWKRLTSQQRVAAMEALPRHIENWAEPEFIPYPASWLNGERWEDEIQPKKNPAPDWWRSTAGIEAKAREVGIVPKLGEDWMSLKARVMAKVAA
jgi:hypothetical protein